MPEHNKLNPAQHSWKGEFNFFGGEFRIMKKQMKLEFSLLLRMLENTIPLPRLTKKQTTKLRSKQRGFINRTFEAFKNTNNSATVIILM